MSINDFEAPWGICIDVKCDIDDLRPYHPIKCKDYEGKTKIIKGQEGQPDTITLYLNSVWSIATIRAIQQLVFKYDNTNRELVAIPSSPIPFPETEWSLYKWVIEISDELNCDDETLVPALKDTLFWQKTDMSKFSEIKNSLENFKIQQKEQQSTEAILNLQNQAILSLEDSFKTVIETAETTWTWIKNPLE